jgi:hypothetical protein
MTWDKLEPIDQMQTVAIIYFFIWLIITEWRVNRLLKRGDHDQE